MYFIGAISNFFSPQGNVREAPSMPGRDEEPEVVGGWRTVAADVYSVVRWLFEAFRDNFIVCYLSSHISAADRSIEITIPKILKHWFCADEIPFSNRMNEAALIEGLKQIESAPAIILTFNGELGEISIEDFVRNHVMTMKERETRKIPNPTRFAFWLCTDDLKKDLLTLEENVQKELMSRMGLARDSNIDLLVQHCRDKMGDLKHHLELLVPSE